MADFEVQNSKLDKKNLSRGLLNEYELDSIQE